MDTVPKPYPKEFRDDVVRVARNRQPGQQLKQIAADFGISESCLTNWIKADDVEEGVKVRLVGEVVGVDQRRAGRVGGVQADCAARARPREDRVQGEVVADLLEGRPEVAPFGPRKFLVRSFRKN